MPKNTPGKFITFEGIEGSGKSTQLTLLENYLRTEGIPFVTTREPGGTDFGRRVRAILLDEQGPARTPISELLLYLSDRYQDLKQVIEPNLEKGTHVLCDRYHDATLAYQGYARGIDLKLINSLASALGIRKPDLTILLDLDVEIGLQRARRRNTQTEAKEGRFEAETLDFHRRVREGYLRAAEEDPERIRILSGLGSIADLHEQIKELVKSVLGS